MFIDFANSFKVWDNSFIILIMCVEFRSFVVLFSSTLLALFSSIVFCIRSFACFKGNSLSFSLGSVTLIFVKSVLTSDAAWMSLFGWPEYLCYISLHHYLHLCSLLRSYWQNYIKYVIRGILFGEQDFKLYNFKFYIEFIV